MKFLENTWIRVAIGLIVLALILFVYLAFSNREEELTLFEVERQNLSYDVIVSGTVQPADQVDLAFEVDGKLENIPVDVGDHVEKEDVLAQLEAGDVQAEIAEVLSDLSSANARLSQFRSQENTERSRLDELKRGTREEELRIAQTTVENAQLDVTQAQDDLRLTQELAQGKLDTLYTTAHDRIQESYTVAFDAVYNRASELFNNQRTDPELNFTATSGQLITQAENQQRTINDRMDAFEDLVNDLSNEKAQLDQDLIDVSAHLTAVRSFLSVLNQLLNFTASLPENTLEDFKATISVAWANANEAVTDINDIITRISNQKQENASGISNAQITLTQKENDLRIAQDELLLKKAGTTSEELRAQEARVEEKEFQVRVQEAVIASLQARVAQKRADLNMHRIVAPFAGVITKQDAENGQIIGKNETFLSMISDAKFEIEVFVPEVEIAFLEVGNMAQLTVDAYGPYEYFEAEIMHIDPAETLRDGVSTYKVTLQFIQRDERIRSGMTANLNIQAQNRSNVLAVPLSSVIREQQGAFLELLEGRNKRRVPVTLGLISSDGFVEIRSGLSENDTVIIQQGL